MVNPPLVERVAYYRCEDHLPDCGRLYFCYSETFASYHLARFNPRSGWSASNGYQLAEISGWFDFELPMPFPDGKPT
jgi:hypothetical protein